MGPGLFLALPLWTEPNPGLLSEPLHFPAPDLSCKNAPAQADSDKEFKNYTIVTLEVIAENTEELIEFSESFIGLIRWDLWALVDSDC